MKQNKRRRKIIAATLALLVLLIGTYAWQSFSQEARNELKGQLLNPGGRLHDHFDGINKFTFVENFNLQGTTGEEEDRGAIYVRMRMDEYMETGSGAGTGTLNGIRVVRGDLPNPFVDTPQYDNKSTWDTYDLLKKHTGTLRSNWFIRLSELENGQTSYLPTFNKRNDNLDSDVNGTYLAGALEEEEALEPYSDYVDYSQETEAVESYAVYTYEEETFDPDVFTPEDDLRIDEELGVYYVKETHTPTQTLPAQKVITMDQWIQLTDGEQIGNFWVCDEDGWAYWAAPLEPETATSSLFGMVYNVTEPSGSWYYANNVVAQMASAGDWGDATNKTGMYGGNGITLNGVSLLNLVADLTRVLRFEILNEDMTSMSTKELLMGTTETLKLVADVKVTYPTGSEKETSAIWTVTEEPLPDGSTSGISPAMLDTYLVDGQFTANKSMEGHNFIITAQSTIDSTFTDSVKVTILDVDTLELFASPNNNWDVIQPGEEVRYVATLSNGAQHDVTWTVTGMATDSTTTIDEKTGILTIDEEELEKRYPTTFYYKPYQQSAVTVTATSNVYTNLTSTHRILIRDWSSITEKAQGINYTSNETINIDGIEWYIVAEKELNGRNAIQLFAADSVKGTTTYRYSSSTSYLTWSGSTMRTSSLDSWLDLDDVPWIYMNAIPTVIDTGYYMTNYTETEGDDENDPVVNEEYTQYTTDSVFLLSYEEWDNLDITKQRYKTPLSTTASTFYWLRTPSAQSNAYLVTVTRSSTDSYIASSTATADSTSETTYGYLRPSLWIYR